MKFYIKIVCMVMEICLNSPWGRCLTHKTFEVYKNSPLFEYRAHDFGPLEAARMLTYSEFKFFKSKVWGDKEFLASIFPWPYQTLKELEGTDYLYKREVKLQYP
jgi:hypothetical protein